MCTLLEFTQDLPTSNIAYAITQGSNTEAMASCLLNACHTNCSQRELISGIFSDIYFKMIKSNHYLIVDAI